MVLYLIYGATLVLKKLKKGVVPTAFEWTKKKNSIHEDRLVLRKSKIKQVEKENIAPEIQSEDMENVFYDQDDLNIEMDIFVVEECMGKSFQDASVQTEIQCAVKYNSNQTQTASTYFMCMYNFEHDNDAVNFYTGLESFQKVQLVFNSLGESIKDMKYIYRKPPPYMTLLNQFFLCLIYLRQKKTHFELSRMFNVTLRDLRNITITWIKVMSLQWREINIWPSKELVKFYTPTDFYKKFPLTRVIIDGTEISINKPALPLAQQATFSQYKNRNTVKPVIGMTPGGLVSFITLTYGGSASDHQIIDTSNLVLKCDPGDSIMADEGSTRSNGGLWNSN
ncbi:hypothetical protein NQ314_016791 [Rhamnusium bicolor]|uniref:DDE Tnp4 domain-containing protein n=1 Tax=Rhamnusium bicolor TaxID=1586634 RepID=A0AAV8WW45_9CUCU|nr:hypothetical protein NQ314_016791 [Rhamnusium bicolor]